MCLDNNTEVIVKVVSFSENNQYCYCKPLDDQDKRCISFHIFSVWTTKLKILPPKVGDMLVLRDVRSKLDTKDKEVWYANEARPKRE
ncbi:MAG: hypothetical protein U9Q15_01910 [Patescibacteria group bacterium]|nr:hypothetical protein [Patescibacteria group bacterium]